MAAPKENGRSGPDYKVLSNYMRMSVNKEIVNPSAIKTHV